MQNMPLVSILMTAYNREKYIVESIESVLSSTYKNFELIIVDDRSTDKTLEIAKQFAEKDKRITVYQNEINLGDYPNRNKAAEYAKGKYLKYLDSDDIIYPTGIEAMVLNMEKFPEAAYGLEYPERQIDQPYPVFVSSHSAYKKHFNHDKIFRCGPSAAIFNTEIFKKESGFSNQRYVGDLEIYLRFSAKYGMIMMQPGLFWWRIHPNQEFAKGNDGIDYRIGNYNVNKEALISEFCPLSEDEVKLLLIKIKKNQRNLLVGIMLKNGQVGATFKVLRKMKW